MFILMHNQLKATTDRAFAQNLSDYILLCQ